MVFLVVGWLVVSLPVGLSVGDRRGPSGRGFLGCGPCWCGGWSPFGNVSWYVSGGCEC